MMAETHITPLKFLKNELIKFRNESTLKVQNSNINNSHKLRIPSLNLISSTDFIIVNNSNLTKSVGFKSNLTKSSDFKSIFFYLIFFFFS